MADSLRKIFSSPTIMTWLSYFVRFGSTIFILPLILLKLPEAEIAVWFVFLLVIGLSQLADSGFGPTIIRATSYFYSGSKHIPKNIKEFKGNNEKFDTINFNGLKSLLGTINIVYLVLGIIAMILILIVGKLITTNSISMTDNEVMLNFAFYLIVIQSFFSLQITKWSSFIQGIDQVASIKRVESVFDLFKIFFSVLVLTLGYGIFGLIAIRLVFRILMLIYVRGFVKKWFKNYEQEDFIKYNFNKKIFLSIWPSTWRFGAMLYGGYLVNNGTGIVVSQINNPTLIASFLLTQRLIFFIRQVSQAPLYANLPRIFQMMAKKEYRILKQFSARAITIGLGMQLIALILLLSIGPEILDLLGAKTSLVPLPIVLIMSISIMLELHHAYHANIYLGTNHVPFLIPAIASGAAIVGISFGIVDSYGLIGIVLVQFFVQLSLNNWYPVYLNLKLLDWKFSDYLKCLMNFQNIFNKNLIRKM